MAKNLNDLSSNVRSLINSSFKHYYQDSGDMFKQFDKWLKGEMLTSGNKRRYPLYFATCLNVVYTQLSELYRDQHCVYCYKVDGVLYTTYNKHKQNNYLFAGSTDIENYRVNPVVESKILNGEYSESGFYFACNGKTFYSIPKERKDV